MEQVVPLARGTLDFLAPIRPYVNSTSALYTRSVAEINDLLDEPVERISAFIVANNSRVAVKRTGQAGDDQRHPYRLWRPGVEMAWDIQQLGDGTPPYLMGKTRDGTLHLAVVADSERVRLPENVKWVSVRHEAHRLDDDECAQATSATALEQWHRQAPYCTRCGSATVSSTCGWTSTCTQCHNVEYPRQDPAIIVAITDDDDRLVLAHNVTWTQGYRSVVAGFMEVGESPEHAVAREVQEELGIVVTNIRYVASQPWPFPRSLMLGFTASVSLSSPRDSSGNVVIRPDGKEITAARFYSRQEYVDALGRQELMPAGEVTFARYLIERWLGEGIPYSR